MALDDWEQGYHIYKLDADEIYSGGLQDLPKTAAIQINSSVHGPMDFAALGTNIFVALNLRYYFEEDDDAPPLTIVYNTKTQALGVGPPLPSGIPAFWAAMAAGEKLYALTTELLSLQAMSWAPTNYGWKGGEMDWSWNSEPSLPPCSGLDVLAYALHPDGRTIFMSTASVTHSFDTSNGLWNSGRSLGTGCCRSEDKPTSTPAWMHGLGFITRAKDTFAAARSPPAAPLPSGHRIAGCSRRSCSATTTRSRG